MTDQLPHDLAAAIALAASEFEDANRGAITDRRSYLDGRYYDRAGWCVTLLHPMREEFRGTTLATALQWCLVWLMGKPGEIGIQGFAG